MAPKTTAKRSKPVVRLSNDAPLFAGQGDEIQYRQLFEMSPDGIVMHQDGIIIDVNSKFLEQLGYRDPADVIGRSLFDMVSTEEREQVVERSRKIQADSNYHPRQVTTVNNRDGEEVYVEVSSRQIIHNGRPAVQSLGRDISERRRIEIQLRQSENRFRDFAEISSDWYWETDSELRYIYVSDQYEGITGIPPEQYLGLHPLVFFDRFLRKNCPDERALWEKICQDMEARRPYRDFNYTHIRPDGSTRIFSTSGRPYFDPNGEFAGYRHVGNDITDIFEAESDLKHTKELLYAAIDNIPVATALFGPDGKLVLHNQKFLTEWLALGVDIRLGITMEAMLKQLSLRGLPPQYAHTAAENFVKSRLEKHNNPKGPLLIQKSDSRWYDIMEYKLPDGSIFYFSFNVTNQVNTEAKLKNSEKSLSEAQRIGQLGSFVIEADGESLVLSDECARLLGIRENRGLSLKDMWRWVPHDEKKDIFTDFFNNGSKDGFRYEFSHHKPGENVSYYRLIGEMVLGKDGNPAGSRGTLQDITELHAESLKLHAAKEQAEQANQAKTRFLGAASHDLRQPLHALGLFAENLSERLIYDGDKQLIENIRQTVVTLDDMFSSIMNITRLDSNAMKPEHEIFKLHILLERLSLEYSAIAAEQNITFKIVPTNLIVSSDPAILDRILRNLFSNAFKYTQQGKVLVGVKKRNGRDFLCVYDTGVGISPEDRPHIFEDFFSSNPKNTVTGNSLGLGLAIVRKAADLLGSEVIVRSVENKGTMFGVSLVACDMPPGNLAIQPVNMIQESLPNMNVGLLDDNPSVIGATTSLLKSWKCGVTNGLQVDDILSSITRSGFTMNVLIADYDLKSDITGIEAAHIIKRETGQDFFTIIISGTSSPKINQMASENGYFFLRKPVKPAKLRALLTHLKTKM